MKVYHYIHEQTQDVELKKTVSGEALEKKIEKVVFEYLQSIENE